MSNISRRNLLKLFTGAASAPFSVNLFAASKCKDGEVAPVWENGIEGQRKADLGNGTFLNPIMPGDHPDPTILKNGDDYYMTFSSFYSYPGLVIWHSTDLVNWAPLGAALSKPLGTVFAVDLCKHDGRYFIYIPALPHGGGMVHLRDLGRRHQRSVERACRSQDQRLHRSRSYRGRGRQTLPVCQRHP